MLNNSVTCLVVYSAMAYDTYYRTIVSDWYYSNHTHCTLKKNPERIKVKRSFNFGKELID